MQSALAAGPLSAAVEPSAAIPTLPSTGAAETAESAELGLPTPTTEDARGPRAKTQAPAWLGVSLQESAGGVLIETVWRGSPAAASGLQPGDLVLRVGDAGVARPKDVIASVATHAPGEVIGVQVLRKQQYRLISVTLDAKPDTEDLLGKLFLGAPAPALDSLRTVQGSVVPSVSPGGSVRVIEFWASWCMACRALGPTLNQWQQELEVLGVEFLGVTMDPFEQAADAARQLGMEYPIFVDETGEVTRAYQGTALPTLFVVDRAGIVRSVTVGYNPAKFDATRALIKSLALAPHAAAKAVTAVQLQAASATGN